jgi:hypothetical protein
MFAPRFARQLALYFERGKCSLGMLCVESAAVYSMYESGFMNAAKAETRSIA